MSSSSSPSQLPPASLAMAQPLSTSTSPAPAAPAAPVQQPASQQQPQPSIAEPSAAATAAAAMPDPASTALPPPPVVPLPTQIGLPAKLDHVDSASSVVAEPPTPLPSASLAAGTGPVTAAAPPVSNGVNGANGHAEAGAGAPAPVEDASSESYNVEAERAVEHDHAHPGLGMYHATAPTAPGEHSSAVDVLADVAMGEAALGLADFASGAGSGDVREGSPAVPVEAPAAAAAPAPADSPSLKRAAPDESTDYVSAGGAAAGTGEVVEDREAKRLKVESDAAVAVPSPVSALPTPVSNGPAPATTPSAAPASLDVPAIPAPALAAPSTSPRPSASPAPPVQGYDPSAFTTAPTLASSAPSYPPPPASAPAAVPSSSAPTMSPSDLHTFGGSPAPGSVGGQSASPMPPSASSAPPPGAALPAEQQQQPVASTSTSAAAPAPATNGAPAEEVKTEDATSDEPALMPIITKEQQKFAINATRNLKRNKNAFPFLKPVDAVALGVPDYYRIITEPMDLGTVESRLQATGRGMAAALKAGKIYGLDYSEGKDPNALWEGQVPPDAPAEEPRSYRTINEFKHDLDLIWNNCFRYNGPREKNPVSGMAGIMSDAAEKAWRSMPVAPMISPYPAKFVPPPKPNPIDYSPRPVEARPKREIHAPAKDLPYLESAGHDVSASGIYNAAGVPGYGVAPTGSGGGGGSGKKTKSAHKIAQEQLRFCKEVIKEMFKKVHEAYAYPFYQPVDLAAYPTYLQYVQKPMDLTTIRYKLEHNQYPMPPYQAFENDVRLIFHNCFAFNPPGTPVNDWGHRLEAVFNAKWSERPISFEESDDEDDVGLSAMEQQLHLLQQNIELMKANKKAQKEAKRLAQMQARMPMPMPMPAPKPAKKPSQAHVSAYSMSPYAMAAATAPPRKKSTSSGARPSGGSQRKPKRRHDEDSDDYYEDDGGAYYGGGSASNSRRTNSGHHHHRAAEPAMEEYVDFDMKRELAVKIVAFEGDQLEEAINIIRRSRPDLLGGANQEIELDIDQLDQRTLVALYRYVVPGSQIPVRPAPGGVGNGAAAPKQSKQPKGGPRNQRKNLDEDKESERIEALEAQLRAFDQAGQEVGAGGGGGGDLGALGGEGEGGAAGAGDQASSDSSEDESSGSDSDEM
ncbi:hypothetical protein B0A53_02872 [Rhodotorula sp. CCFEE 5036]|nr:hypothetical protein B0A53_02872 [Rhodotorula sp. CCFEE 5036]